MPGISAVKTGIPFSKKGFNFSSYWATRTPTLLNVTSQTDTTIDFAWTAGADEPEGYILKISTDGVTYADKTTVAGNVTTAQATGLTAGVLYYFKVVAYSGTNESDPTNIYDTGFKITVDTTKAGSANTHFVLPVTAKSAGDYYVDWGDGGAEETFTTTGNKDHTYDATGTYQVKVRGGLTAISFANAGDKAKVMSVDNWGNIKWSSCTQMFYGCASMTATYTDQPNTAAVILMYSMFRSCALFNGSVSGFNTANVTNMAYMFRGCTVFNKSISNFNTAKVTDMNNMFYGCTAFNQSVSSFNTANVTDMSYMFYACDVFNQSVANFNTAKVTVMANMFQACTVFNQSVANFNTAIVTNFASMFQGCPAFKQSLATFSLAAATNLTSMLLASNINGTGSTANYDSTLVAWGAQDPTNSLTFSGGNTKYGEGLVDSGTTDGAAASKLIQSGQNFVTTVTIGDVVYNTTDGTYALVTGIDSDTQLAISADIMTSGENYRIQHSDAAKARAKLKLTDLWTITDGGPSFDNGQLIINFDNGLAAQYTIVFPDLVTQGVKGTFYIVSSDVGSAGIVTWAQLQEMLAAGMDIQCHTYDHAILTTLSEAQVYAEYDDLDADFVANSIPAANHTAYPNSAHDANVRAWTATRRLTGRAVAAGYITSSSDKFNLPCYDMATEINTLKSLMLVAQNNMYGLMLYTHDLSEATLPRTKFNEIIDYAQSIGMSIITISELYPMIV